VNGQGVAAADLVIARRSPACGADCQAAPCTLAQMRAAQRTAVTDPRITLWAELSVIAHLIGWEMPRPGLAFFFSLRELNTRLRDCALSHAVDAAVAARVPAIGAKVSPAALAVHVVAVMRVAVTEDKRACAPEESQYLAPLYKWEAVRHALRPAFRKPPAPRHPRSEEWERDYGQPIPGATVGAQLNTVARWYLRDQANSTGVAATLYGSRPRPALERVVGTARGSADWNGALKTALEPLDCQPWVRRVLSRPTESASGGTKGKPSGTR
jgi:hypothetical protein